MTLPASWSTAVLFSVVFPNHTVVRNLTKKKVLARLERRLHTGRTTPDDIWYTILVQGFDQLGNPIPPHHPIRLSNCPAFAQDLRTAPWFQPYWQSYQPVGNPPPPPEPRFLVRDHLEMTILEIIEFLTNHPEQQLFIRTDSTHDWKEARTVPDISSLLKHRRGAAPNN